MKKLSTIFVLTACILTSCIWGKNKNIDIQSTLIDTEKSKITETVLTENITTEEEEMMKKIIPTDTPKSIVEWWIYLPYTPTSLAQAKWDIILFFYAPWCPYCIESNKDISSKVLDIPKNLTILKVNYDDEAELRKIYGVTTQHTFIQIDNNGKLIKKWSGSASLSELLAQIEKTQI